MKHIFLAGLLFIGANFTFAGNGETDPPCNCGSKDKTDIFAAGTATLEGGNQVKCSGDAGTCWEVTFKPGGGWVLTIYIEPPLTFSNGNSQDNPPAQLVVINRQDTYVIYEWDPNVWKKK